MFKAFVVSSVCLFSSQLVFANQSTPGNLFDLSLQELLNIEVSVASASSESVIQTPAIVSRFSRREMENMGISNLRELFNFVPGVIVQDSLTGIASVQIRGVDETFNQKVLFLLNGVPYHQPSHSFIPMEGVPWEAISHIEVIRGPGSVFHGTQASGGVFNVVTLDHQSANTASLKLGYHSLKEGSAFLKHQFSEQHGITIAAEYRDEGTDSVLYEQVFPDVGLVTDTVDRFLDRESVLLTYQNQSFSAMVQKFNDTTVGINDAFTDQNTLQPFVVESTGELIHIKNDWENSQSRLTLYADYNYYTFDLYLNNLFADGVGALATKDGNGRDDNRWRAGVEYVNAISANLDFAAGLEFEKRSVGAYRLYAQSNTQVPLTTLFPQSSVNESSLYAQLTYTFNNWRLFLGGRNTDNENNGNKFNPRYAVVYKMDEYQSIKAVYSSGFNSPNPTQTDIFLPGNVIGTKNLNAEVVKSYDFAYSYAKDGVLFVANVYRMKAEDFIIRRFSQELASVTFFNAGNYVRRGAELDFQKNVESGKLYANLAYQADGNRLVDDDLDAYRVPRVTLSAGASKNVIDKQSIGGELSYIGERNGLKGYGIVNLNYRMNLGHYEWFVYLRNVFDAKIVNPNNSAQRSTLVALGEQGRNLQVGVRVGF